MMVMTPIAATWTGEQLMEESCLRELVFPSSPHLGKPVHHYDLLLSLSLSYLYLTKYSEVQIVPIPAVKPSQSFQLPHA